MSTIRRICDATKRTAKKIVKKAGDLADSAVTALKIRNLEMKIEEKYEDLGAVVYRDLHTDEILEEEKLRIIAEIDALFDALAELKGSVSEKEQPAEEAPTEEAPAEEAPTEEE